MSAITAKASRKMKKYAVLTREPRCFLGSFDFSWEQRKLTEFVEFFSGLTYTPNDVQENGTLVLRSSNVSNGEVVDADNIYVNPQVVNSENVKVGDIVVVVRNGSRSLIGKHAQIKAFMPNTVIGAFMTGIRSECPEFTNALLNTSRFEEEIAMNMGATINQITGYMFSKMEFKVPCLDEQKKIGEYFEKLDNLITLHQRKCANLCSPSQVVFSLLFATSTFSWEQRKFDEVFDCTVPNNTLSRAELSYDEGTVLNVHYGDVLIKYGSVLDVQKDDIPRIPHRCREDFNGALLQDGDVIIADTAEDETTGKACEIGNLQGSAIVSGLHTMVCRPRNRMALGYLGYYLNSNAYHHQLLPLMQGIKVLSLSRSNIQKTSVSYPIAVKEQQLIAYYFSQLDNLITLHQRECISFTGRADRLILTANKKRTTSSWEQRKAKEICSIGTGKSNTQDQVDDGKYPFYIRSDVPVRSNKYLYDCEAVITIGDGNIGKVFHYVNGKFDLHQRCYKMTDFKDIWGKYFFYYFSTKFYDRAMKMTAKATVDSVRLEMISEMDIKKPPQISEQKQIAEFFANLDNLITLHQRKPFLMKWRTSDANRNQTNRLVL